MREFTTIVMNTELPLVCEDCGTESWWDAEVEPGEDADDLDQMIWLNWNGPWPRCPVCCSDNFTDPRS